MSLLTVRLQTGHQQLECNRVWFAQLAVQDQRLEQLRIGHGGGVCATRRDVGGERTRRELFAGGRAEPRHARQLTDDAAYGCYRAPHAASDSQSLL